MMFFSCIFAAFQYLSGWHVCMWSYTCAYKNSLAHTCLLSYTSVHTHARERVYVNEYITPAAGRPTAQPPNRPRTHTGTDPETDAPSEATGQRNRDSGQHD